MAKSDYQTAVNNWNRRASQLRAAGVADSVWKPLAQRDLTAVTQKGSTPMADAEVNDALRAGMGISPIKDPKQSTGGLFDIIGNIPSDVSNLVTGFIPGMVNEATQLPDLYKSLFGTQAQRAKIAQQYGISTPHDLGD